MVQVERTVKVAAPIGAVARYLADFAHTEDWDPGTIPVTRTGPGPIVVGARWHNVSEFRGRKTELRGVLDELG